jgi:hypothetical protein
MWIWTGRVAQAVQSQSSKCEALNSNPRAANNNNNSNNKNVDLKASGKRNKIGLGVLGKL